MCVQFQPAGSELQRHKGWRLSQPVLTEVREHLKPQIYRRTRQEQGVGRDRRMVVVKNGQAGESRRHTAGVKSQVCRSHLRRSWGWVVVGGWGMQMHVHVQ